MSFACRANAATNKFAGILTAGTAAQLIGFRTSSSTGALAPSSAFGGSIVNWSENTSTLTDTLSISGLSSDPGQNAFVQAVVTGIGSLNAASATYSYSAGVATWTWTTAGAWQTMVNGNNYSVYLT